MLSSKKTSIGVLGLGYVGLPLAVSFAKKAISTRFPEKELKRIKIDFKDLLKPVRKEDNGKDLWSVFNVVQEKIISGDFEYAAAGKIRKAREIKNFKQDLELNQKLFDLAGEYVDENAVIA